MKIVVLDGYAANPGDLCWDELKALGECTVYDRTAPAEVLERSAGAEILLTNKTVITAEHIAALPELKYIGVLATGYNIVDVIAAKEHGVIVTNIPAYSTDSVAQMVFAHILNIALQVQHHSEEVHKGRWTDSKDFCFWDTPLIELHGKKIGIVGLGHTGYATARIAIGFGMQVYAYTSKTHFQLPPEIHKMELDELFRECDIISLHCPLTDSTREMVNAARLRLMKSTAILINTGPGPLINEQALADALNTGTFYAPG
ncbi:MAG: D-2-hydroxyacid dehydrogenase, partial [Bacteroides sp.]|nr:D-2-hydroxyacid dehydrogenase [Bacteroides sp.]